MNKLNESATFGQLFNLSEPKRIVRSNTVKGPPLDIQAFDDAQFYFFNFKSNPSTTGLRHHGYIKFHRPKRDMALTDIPCEVDCTCQDYRYRWAWTNKQRGAGRVGNGSLNQALNRAPRITNPGNRPGLCKHILALKNFIQGMMWELPNTGIESSDDVLRNLVSYASRRWANLPQQMSAAKARDARSAASRAMTRAGRQMPSPDQLPSIPGTDEVEPPPPRVPYVSEQPEMPTDPDSASKIRPPNLRIQPEDGKKQESKSTSKVDKLCAMKPLIEELKVLKQLIEDEEQTPSTAGEASRVDALALLKSIDSGIQRLNQGIESLSVGLSGQDKDKTPGTTEDPEGVNPPKEGSDGQTTDDGDGMADLEKELETLGLPKK